MRLPNWKNLIDNGKRFAGEDFFKSDVNCKKQQSVFFWYFIGILSILSFYFPQLININEAAFRVHDYLEQDFVNIHLNAKYLFSPEILEIKELFGGTFRGSIQTHGIFYVFLYKVIQGSVFLTTSKIIVSIFGFSGMYLLFDKLYHFEKTAFFYIIATYIAFLYCIIPQLLHGVTAFLLPWAAIIFLDISFNGKKNWLFFITLFAGQTFQFFYIFRFCFLRIFLLVIRDFFLQTRMRQSCKVIDPWNTFTYWLYDNIILYNSFNVRNQCQKRLAFTCR